MSESTQRPSRFKSFIYAFGMLYLLFGIIWAILIGEHTHELLAEHGTRDRYNEITRVVRAQRTVKAIIEVCVEGRRLEIEDPDGFAIVIPVWSVDKALEERAEDPIFYQSVLLGREQVREDCSPPNEYPVDVLQFELGSVDSIHADGTLDALRPPDGSKAAVYELAASWDGGATISDHRLLALVFPEPRLFQRHYVVFRIQPTYAKGATLNPLHLAGNMALDVVTFPHQLAALVSYMGAH